MNDFVHPNGARSGSSDAAATGGSAALEAAVATSLSRQQALALADYGDTAALLTQAAQLRDSAHRNLITYSRKVFIPLTHLCRDVCHYCTFAQTPKNVAAAYMSEAEVLSLAHEGAKAGCKEALFTLGEKPELRYKTARQALAQLGFATTLEYVAHVARRVFEETGIFPHINAGCMSAEEIAMLKPVSASMGIMLESASSRLCEKGGVHYGSPDKDPAVRLETLRLAGEAKVPFTTGILIGIGETRRERIESLLAIRDLHERYGHIQEIIIQNFRAKPHTKMSAAPEPDLDDMLWTLAVARLIFGAQMNIQAPPNLSPGVLPQLVAAGINDWGGVSPLTPDFVNPEAPWPHLQQLAAETAAAGKYLQERLTVYPRYIVAGAQWFVGDVYRQLLHASDTEGFPRVDDWCTGSASNLPAIETQLLDGHYEPKLVSDDIGRILAAAARGDALDEQQIIRLFQSRGDDFTAVCRFADTLRQQQVGDRVTYVVNRNINYTNICYFKCKFCAFSKGKLSENLRGRPYDLSADEIRRRTIEAWQRGATEVCMQGGIHPEYTGQTYLDICQIVKTAVADMHIHAFSPLEVWQGAQTLGTSLQEFLSRLRQAGLSTLPGTAAEILDDEVREHLCPDKINTEQWLTVMRTAHSLQLRSTATIMFGHIEQLKHWARHLLQLRELQQETGGFTEFVPLPFVAEEAPIYLRSLSRKGPTFRESVLMHAVSRIVLGASFRNIQTSWVKLGAAGVKVCLTAGANDLGGTLMNESITRAAGAEHGEEMPVQMMDAMINSQGREPCQRTTLYAAVSAQRRQAALTAAPLQETDNTKNDTGKRNRSGERRRRLIVSG